MSPGKKKKKSAQRSARATLAFGRALIRGGLQQITTTMHETDLTLMQLGTLILLQRGTLSVSEIAESRHLSLSATSHMLNRLVARDLVRREEDSEDRRQKRISLGSAGVAMLAQFDLGRERALSHVLTAVPKPLQLELEEVLTRVMAVMGERPPTPGSP